MSLQELFQAMNMFKQGAQEFGAARAIGEAQSQIETLKNQEMDEMERRQQLSALSNNLTLDLAKIGAPASQIATAVGAVAPPKISDANDAFMQASMAPPGKGDALMGIAKSAQEFGDASKQKDRENELAKARINADAVRTRTASSLDSKQSKLLNDDFKKFEDRKDIKDLRASLDQVGQLEVLLGDESQTGFELSKLKLIKLAQGAGVVTDRDAAKATGDKDFASMLMRGVSQRVAGVPYKDDVTTFKRLADVLTQQGQGRLRSKVKAHSARQSGFFNMDPRDYEERLISGFDIAAPTPVSATASGSGSAAAVGNFDVEAAKRMYQLDPDPRLKQAIEVYEQKQNKARAQAGR